MIKVVSDIQFPTIMRRRGLGTSGKARKYLAASIIQRAGPYTPMQSGTLKNTAQILWDGRMIHYNQPYAHYQYHGKVMGPNILTKDGWRSKPGKGKKQYTGKNLTYHGAPMRGAQWVDRMLAAHMKELEQDLVSYCSKEASK